jgi:hydroxyacylglutathione hydrolase
MKLEQIYTGCLAQGAYFIESEGEAVIIDPLREVQSYLERAQSARARIKYIFETHFHADFVSGHLELANVTGATIVYGPTADTSFPAHIARDGECFTVGKIQFTLLHTPGHTLESSCYLLKDEEGKDVALFTGDTLFIGDVGRPDLAQKPESEVTQEHLAGLLYESLQQKILPLADDIVLYPAHGAGSACGKNMSKETWDTLGRQKQNNYALRPGLRKSEFIREVTAGLQPPPAYFPVNVQLNRQGYDPLDKVLDRGMKALSLSAFKKAWDEHDALLLDTRSASQFAEGFIPGAINIGLDGSFAPWVGALVPYKRQPILLIADEGREEEAVTRLARIGCDDTIGYLKGGFNTWKEAQLPMDQIQQVTANELAHLLETDPAIQILDVRKESEFSLGHIPGARNLPLDRINEAQPGINKHQPYYVHCAGGYRSMVFISILRARGYHRLVDVQGGFSALQKCTGFVAAID